MKKFSYILLLLFGLIFPGCKSDEKPQNPSLPEGGREIEIKYARGLSIVDFGKYVVITVKDPWPQANRSYKYLLAEADAEVPENVKFDQRIQVPVEKVVVTSTTHIPSLESLNAENTLVGFPGLEYISSEKTRKLIAADKITEVGKNEALNTETLLNLRPDVVIGFSIDGSNKSLNTLQKSGTPVVFNADWTEHSPLGKVEWIKFFGAFFGKTEAANAIFEQVEKNYLEAKALAQKAETRPSVMAGSMYKDQWYMPAGDSWQALFLEDANANYLFADSPGTGSLSLSLEAVLAQAANADFWVGPAQFTAYDEMEDASPHYRQFKAFKEENVFTFSSEKGETGGVIFYELAPNRPDLVLKDLISIFHPQLLPGYETTFYKPLE